VLLSLVLSSHHLGPAYVLGLDCTGASGNNFNIFALSGCGTLTIGCHNTTTSNNVVIELDSAGIAVKSYHPGQSYTVKISATNGNAGSHLPYFGFQMASVLLLNAGDSVSMPAGAWDTTSLPPRVRYDYIGPWVSPGMTGSSGWPIPIVEHSDTIPVTSGSGDQGSTYTESVTWMAPDSGKGTIILYGALNTVNGDGQNTGDFNQAAVPDTITEGSGSYDGINTVAPAIYGLKVYPTLMSDNVTITFDLPAPSTVSADLISTDGQVVKAYMSQEPVAGGAFRRSLDVSGLASGIYFVRVQIGGSTGVSKVVKE
jgi:hypothetical protein